MLLIRCFSISLWIHFSVRAIKPEIELLWLTPNLHLFFARLHIHVKISHPGIVILWMYSNKAYVYKETMIDDIHTYIIKVRGSVDQDDVNAASPVTLTVDCADESATILSACTDQSGLIGILRHLHGMGFVLISIHIDDKTS